ncbi:MAG: rod shape-determining protein MreD [Actinomycetota bacterium]
MAVTAHKARGVGGLSELGLGRMAAFAGMLLLAVAIQSTLLAQATILGVIPQLVLVVVISLAFLDGERVGTVMGFFGGLLIDMLLPNAIVGLTALIYTLLGYGVGLIRYMAPPDSVWTPVFAVAGASAVAELGYAALAIIMGQRWVSLSETVKIAGLVVLYNTLLTPFVFPLVRRVADRFRPEKVYRW